ncbi:MAG: hypothetical protein CMO43_01710 [Verrucomicrobiales bacterium]|nr:hypothetical protein [Verrucomicrobiales bacterium]
MVLLSRNSRLVAEHLRLVPHHQCHEFQIHRDLGQPRIIRRLNDHAVKFEVIIQPAPKHGLRGLLPLGRLDCFEDACPIVANAVQVLQLVILIIPSCLPRSESLQ